MKFIDFEEIMSSRGFNTLADISRALDSTPQAVSNWKSRDQVPHYIVNRIIENNEEPPSSVNTNIYPQIKIDDDIISFSDILLTLAEQIKVILFVPFILMFLTFTYIQFIQQPTFESWSTVLIPNQGGQQGGIAGIASQFGVNMNSNPEADLSSPVLLPEILKSRTFAEKLLQKKLYAPFFDNKTSLINILVEEKENYRDEKIIKSLALSRLDKMIDFEQNINTGISTVRITTYDPKFSRDLATAVIEELEESNRFYKSQSAIKKTFFIENRIKSVEKELLSSEKNLKIFNEQNQQISSPALQLQLERLNREVEVQKGIYLILKQQLELAKIEEIQESSILQILDRPRIPIGPSNDNLNLGVMLAAFIGLISGTGFGFFRSYFNKTNTSEKKKMRRMRLFFKKKTKEIVLDKRISLIISIMMICASPFYFSHKSANPAFFGMYSSKLFLVNFVYLILMISFIFIYFKTSKNKITKNNES